MTDLLPHAERREHTLEHVIRCHGADQLVQRTHARPEMCCRGDRVHALRPRGVKRIDLAERTLERHAMACAGHHRLDITQTEELAERDFGEAALQGVETVAGEGGDDRDGGRGTGDG